MKEQILQIQEGIMIFLDTDIISFYIKGVPEIYGKINEAFDNNDILCTTMIN